MDIEVSCISQFFAVRVADAPLGQGFALENERHPQAPATPRMSAHFFMRCSHRH
jgi:hypothetical protein